MPWVAVRQLTQRAPLLFGFLSLDLMHPVDNLCTTNSSCCWGVRRSSNFTTLEKQHVANKKHMCENYSSPRFVFIADAMCTSIVFDRSSFDRCFGATHLGASNSNLLSVLRDQNYVHQS